MRFLTLLLSAASLISAEAVPGPPPPPGNSSYTNPILPGWHSDPSCTFVPTLSTTFCITSSFLSFPGLPLYSSCDLSTWTLASNVFSRPSQVPQFATLDTDADEGFWAATVRWHDGVLYVVVGYVDYDDAHHQTTTYLLFTSTDPFSSSSWSDGLKIANPQGTIDGDLFWDDDGTVYMASGWGAIYLSTVDLSTGTVSPVTKIWNGTGGSNPEGPHIYRKDGSYYLLIAEGGSGPNHMVTIARSTDIWGPYESFAGNPILTNKGTDEYFQTVGHADFFTDGEGNWWGAALSTRSGSDFAIYPMGRETVLYPVSWPEGGWPVAEPVRGEMSGWHQPAVAPPRPDEIVVDGADVVDFRHGEKIPENWVHYRIPDPASFVVSPKGHENTLQLVPSASNLSGNAAVDVKDGLTFIGRRQTATLFEFSVDVEFDARIEGEEAGITVFISQGQHIDLSIIAGPTLAPQLRFRAATFGKANATAVEERVVDIPKAWLNAPIRLLVEAKDDERYTFSASSTRGKPEVKQMGTGGADILTGGLGRFVGTLVGAYATNNNGNGTASAYLSRWRYTPIAQKIAEGVYVPVKPVHP